MVPFDFYNNAPLIGLASAHPRVGKDTTAKALRGFAKSPVEFSIGSFAAPLTLDFLGMFPDNPDTLEIRNDPVLKEHKFNFFALKNVAPEFDKYVAFCVSKLGYSMDQRMSAREHLILYGTDYIRKFCNDNEHWCKAGMQMAKQRYLAGDSIVFTDVRFPNEVYAIRDAGGIVVWIEPNWQQPAMDAVTASAQQVHSYMCNFSVESRYGEESFAAKSIIQTITKGL